jgi:hypothetical protein
VVELAQLQVTKADPQVDEAVLRTEAEIQLTDDGATPLAVSPGTDEQFGRLTLGAHGVEIIEGARQEEVVPASDIQGRRPDAFVLLRYVQRFPHARLPIHIAGYEVKEDRADVITTQGCELREREGPLASGDEFIDLAAQQPHRLAQRGGVAPIPSEEDVQTHQEVPIGH